MTTSGGSAVAGEPGFDVDSQALRRHAGSVDEVAEMVDQCRRAAGSVQLGRHAYGRLCQLIPSLLDPVQRATVNALNEAADALQRTADDVRTVARHYESGDQDVAGLFGLGAER
ncbi:type VII secretion target [Micromonospora sp. NPDC051296]|uniref:type VII secretion target n=1 Tax=Micromonospora sp. NPDC051296 TaxID=3155046 RepID=UPI003433CC18